MVSHTKITDFRKTPTPADYKCMFMLRHVMAGARETYISNKSLARLLGLTESTVRLRLRRLESLGFLELDWEPNRRLIRLTDKADEVFPDPSTRRDLPRTPGWVPDDGRDEDDAPDPVQAPVAMMRGRASYG